jgi:hypothetical protein
MTPERQADQLTPEQDAWLEMIRRKLPKPTTHAEWRWVLRQVNLSEDRRRAAITSVLQQSLEFDQ